MGNYYAIKNRFSQNVIDIQGDSTQAGALLDGYPETNPPSDNQLWEFVPDPLGSGYFFIKSKLNGNVIDIQGKSEASGALLDAFPQSGTDNQLWQFVVDPVSGWYFIMSKMNGNVIDVQGSSVQPKALLTSYPPTYPAQESQLWVVLFGSPPAQVAMVPAPAGGLGSNLNYLLHQDCNPFVNHQSSGDACLTINIDITEDIICKSSSGSTQGFGFQLNCWSPKTRTCAYQQYGIALFGSDLIYIVEYWNVSNSKIFNSGAQNLLSLPSPMLPQGYRLVISLFSDQQTGNIVSVNYTVINSEGSRVANVTQQILSVSGASAQDIAPIVAFELVLVGPDNGDSVVLSQGAGIISYWAPNNLVVFNTQTGPPLQCMNFGGGTGETANSVYGSLPATPNQFLKQGFSVQAPT
jgi:hypothetical protein